MIDSPNLPFVERVRIWNLPPNVEDAILAEVDTSAHEAEVTKMQRDFELVDEQLDFARNCLRDVLHCVSHSPMRYSETKQLITAIKAVIDNSMVEL